MLIIFSFESFCFILYLLILFALGYKVYSALHGFIAILTIIFFIAITVGTVVIMVAKAVDCRSSKASKSIIIWNFFLSFIASVISLYTCYLFMKDLRIYDDSLWGMVGVIISTIFGGGLWLMSTAGWVQAIVTDDPTSFNYKGFLLEIIAAGVLYWLTH